jgi:hypothetical protein
LTDSPWAKPTTVIFDRLRAEIYLTIRWASALPVRQALALEQAKTLELPRATEAEYVIEIAGFPTTLFPQGARRLEAELAKSARLSAAGRRTVTPASVSVPGHGMHLMATLCFPRFEPLDAKDRDITIWANSGSLSIEQRFKLKDMVYEGHLEL